MGPRRDLVKELFDASRRYTPELHRGLYFSMPEWFNPDHPWMGHAPRNPYTLEPVPYTGYTAGKDYVTNRYHQPADEWQASWTFAGMTHDLPLLYKVGADLANSTRWPDWAQDSEFRATRDASAAERK
jgi:Zn-dependent M28 family amino/carboxypeptidase